MALPYTEHQLVRARLLVSHSRMAAVNSLQSLESANAEFGDIAARGIEVAWHTLFLVGCVGVAMMEMGDLLAADDCPGQAAAIKAALSEWDPWLYDGALTSLTGTILTDIEEQGMRHDDAIGRWLWRVMGNCENIGQRLNSLAVDTQVHRITGHLILAFAHDFWHNLPAAVQQQP